MQRQFFRGIFLLLFLNLLIKPFWLLGIDRNVQLQVGNAAYGFYYALFNFSFLLTIILDPGIHAYNNRKIAQEPELLKRYLPSILTVKLLLSLSYMVVTLLLAYLLGYNIFRLKLLVFLALNQVLLSFTLYQRSNLSALHRFGADSMMSVMDRLLMILMCGFVLWTNVAGPFQVEWFVYIQTVAYGITVIFGFALLPRLKFGGLRWDSQFLLGILRRSYSFAILSLLMALYTKIDVVMLERMLPDGEHSAGIYAASYRILEALNMVGILYASFLLPVLSRMLKQKQETHSLMKNSTGLVMVPALLVALVCNFYARPIMDLLYPGDAPEHAAIFALLMFSVIATCGVYLFGTLLTANNNLRFLNIVATTGAAGNILLNFLLIPAWGILGAVAATIATQFFVTIAHFIKSQRLFRYFSLRKEGWRYILFAVFAVSSFVLLYRLFDRWFLNALLLTLINLIFASFLGLLSPHKVILYLKKNPKPVNEPGNETGR